MKYYIGVDIGTSSTKTVLFDRDGSNIATSSSEYDIIVKENGYAEQNPNDWYNAVVKTIANVSKRVDKDNIIGIGLSGQMHGLVLLDKDDNILYNAIIWCDNRTIRETKEIEDILGREKVRKITGNYPMPAFTLAKLLWIKNNYPDIFSKIDKVLLPKDYIRYVLTNEFKTEYSDASGTQMLDIVKREYSKEILNAFDIKEDILPKLCESVEITGYLTCDIADMVGLNANTFVVGGAGDQAAGAIGNGILETGDLSIVLGSSGVVFAPIKKLNLENDKVQYFCHAIKDTYHIMGVTNGAGNSLKWYKDNLCQSEILKAKEEKIPIYDYLTKDLKDIPVGSNGLIFLPYLMGERTPYLDPYATGCFIGLRGSTTKEYITRAILEGVSYSMLDCYKLIDSNITNVLISGGGAKNTLWCEIVSSMIEENVNRILVDEGPALGVAILAMVAGNEYKTVKEACTQIVKIKDTIIPNKEWTDIYLKLYKIYKLAYINNKELFELTNKLLEE